MQGVPQVLWRVRDGECPFAGVARCDFAAVVVVMTLAPKPVSPEMVDRSHGAAAQALRQYASHPEELVADGASESSVEGSTGVVSTCRCPLKITH